MSGLSKTRLFFHRHSQPRFCFTRYHTGEEMSVREWNRIALKELEYSIILLDTRFLECQHRSVEVRCDRELLMGEEGAATQWRGRRCKRLALEVYENEVFRVLQLRKNVLLQATQRLLLHADIAIKPEVLESPANFSRGRDFVRALSLTTAYEDTCSFDV